MMNDEELLDHLKGQQKLYSTKMTAWNEAMEQYENNKTLYRRKMTLSNRLNKSTIPATRSRILRELAEIMKTLPANFSPESSKPRRPRPPTGVTAIKVESLSSKPKKALTEEQKQLNIRRQKALNSRLRALGKRLTGIPLGKRYGKGEMRANPLFGFEDADLPARSTPEVEAAANFRAYKEFLDAQAAQGDDRRVPLPTVAPVDFVAGPM